ncbi:MAG: transcription termination/antitermination protein NusG [Alphaproteobacteria bacterium]|nr:MAG: transcription termination/antitermination protein NusG [Alphaproteobacteria bacterium]
MAARWYVVHVYSSFEKKVAEMIKEQALRKGLDGFIKEVLVPTQSVIEVKRGEKVNAERQFFPGYVLVNMELDDDAWHMVRNIPKVTGFLGAQGKPAPVSQKEVDRIMNQLEEGVASVHSVDDFEIGQEVQVCDGPFSSFNGIVEEIDQARLRLKVSVSIFGRPTPVDLEFSQVKKL